MAAKNDATVIILDVGKNSAERESDDSPSFYDQAKKCVEALLLQKIFTKREDSAFLLLMGTKDTDNEMNEHYGDYEHISTGFPFQPIGWPMVNHVKNSIDPPNESVTADWLDAIIVAMHCLREANIPKTKSKIILLTTFTTKVNTDEVKKVIRQIKELGIDLIAITTNVVYKVHPETHIEHATINNSKSVDADVIQSIVAGTNGSLCNVDDALSKLAYLDNKSRRRMPWNVDLKIGSQLKLKVATYIYLQEVKELKPWSTRDKNGKPASSRFEHFHDEKLIPPEEVADKLIDGYIYGQTGIAHENAEKFNNGGKSLICLGFTKRSNIKDEYLSGESIRAMVPQKGFGVAAKQFTGLTTAMRENELVMIARYTYNANSTPKMVALIPNTTHEDHPDHHSLLMFELFYKNNMVNVNFPTLASEKTKPSNEQYDAMVELINSMDLMSTGESSGKFEKLVDLTQQKVVRAVVKRALDPDDPVQRKPDEDLLDLMTPPKTAELEQCLQLLKPLFPLEVAKATKAAFFQKIRETPQATDKVPSKDDDSNNNNNDLSEIGTRTPAEDFAELLHRGERFSVLAGQMQKVIIDLVFKTMTLMEEKIVQAIFIYRETAKNKAAYSYNEWIQEFKQKLLDFGKLDLWQKLVVEQKLGLITNEESDTSTANNKESAEFYEVKVPSAGAQMDVDNNDDADEGDVLEDM